MVNGQQQPQPPPPPMVEPGAPVTAAAAAPAVPPAGPLAISTGSSIVKHKPRRSFYMRTLPSNCTAFASPQGRVLFREALSEGTMETYFRLADHFLTQDDPAFCGLSTLTMALNALSVDPGRVWKGRRCAATSAQRPLKRGVLVLLGSELAWRWYHESLLDCCVPLEKVRENGIVIGQDARARRAYAAGTGADSTLVSFACLARCNGVRATVRGPRQMTLEKARALVVEVCSRPETDRVLIASYHRGTLGQTGSGHFSPLGGYHAASDSVLILDVARFKCPSHWVPLPLL
ncbi:hypothetical protein JKP88DRAFT_279734 [Tribonema minus]|uniref:glutathione gamma-glutamylcysteinyltransferase n=1 Tax=Tribonema minus TaxID=303371 RepID=A0A835YSK4_9STRA|nr:hypothetical protein JKP88DRAFT_279734 [Tribonema minus]